jgi:hypothetical protein
LHTSSRLAAGTEFFLQWTLRFCRPTYVHQLDFDGAGRQGKKQGVVEVEFDTSFELDRQMLLIQERDWHTLPSQLELWIALILLAFVELLAFA